MDNASELREERQWVQRLLQVGLALSMVLMLVGLSIKLARGNTASFGFDLHSFFSGGAPLGDRVMELGILILAFTPFFRVLALLFLWIRERDWIFVGVSALVLALLALSIALGGG